MRYNIYPSLLDAYTRYLGADDTYDRIWGFSEVPSKSREEFLEEQLQEFLDSLNRVPFESVYADLGTAFNDLVDEAILGEPRGETRREERGNTVVGTLRGREYIFPREMVEVLAERYALATPQLYVEGEVRTRYGGVHLYGYLDELMPFAVHDIKVTHRYEPWKFKENAQHLVYPLCVEQMGLGTPYTFQYDIMEVRSNAGELQKQEPATSDPCIVMSWEHIREEYGFQYEEAEKKLVTRCESFIEWIEEHRGEIDNPKLFGLER